MSLIEIIQDLKTNLHRQEDEYECTSDFLEWFYYNIYRQQGFNVYPILSEISKDPEYASMCELCRMLINFFKAKELDDETLSNKYEKMKKWTLDVIQKYNQAQ
jgi:hypothetical protein